MADTDTYRSNEGRGPLRARIVERLPYRRVRMYRWHEKRGDARRVYFTLPERFLESASCGWRLMRHG